MKYPTHALRVVDNWDGEGDIVYLFACLMDGIFYSYDSGKPVLEYAGDRILDSWPLRTNS